MLAAVIFIVVLFPSAGAFSTACRRTLKLETLTPSTLPQVDDEGNGTESTFERSFSTNEYPDVDI